MLKTLLRIHPAQTPALRAQLNSNCSRAFTASAINKMDAPTALGFGIASTSKFVPDDKREGLQKILDIMESTMNESRFDWEMVYYEPGDDYSIVEKKMREKKWDVVLVGSTSPYGF